MLIGTTALYFVLYRGVEQLVAHRAHNPKVAGSNPAPATITGVDPLVSACFFMYARSSIALAYVVPAYFEPAYVVPAYVVHAYVVHAYVVHAYVVPAYVALASIAPAFSR